MLKRVLLAYARWNKRVGYCQGFNVLAALILDVMGRKEDDALKVNTFAVSVRLDLVIDLLRTITASPEKQALSFDNECNLYKSVRSNQVQLPDKLIIQKPTQSMN